MGNPGRKSEYVTGELAMELRKINPGDSVAQWEYTTMLPREDQIRDDQRTQVFPDKAFPLSE